MSTSTTTLHPATLAAIDSADTPIGAGDQFRNGLADLGIQSVSFNYGELLTVVRRDARTYGVTRYIVVDRYGRHGYAY